MKKVISLIIVIAILSAIVTVSLQALSVSDDSVISAHQAVENEGLTPGDPDDTQRIYFQMPDGNRGPVADHDVKIINPETGNEEVFIEAGEKAPSWYSDYNIVDGQHYAGVYWWGGTAACPSWCGYRAEIEDYDQGIYYADVPKDVVRMIWNNGVDGGSDSSEPIYYEAAQTIVVNIEGAYVGDYEECMPYGSPDNDYFDNCIYVIDPSQVSIYAYNHHQECGGNWYVYYGNGCYGQEYAPGGDNNDYPDGTDGWTGEIADVCMNPDHFVNGVHVGYHEDVLETEPYYPTLSPTWTPTEPMTEPPTWLPTWPPTEPETEPVTVPETEPVTEPVTEPPTEPPTEIPVKLGDVDYSNSIGVTDVTYIQYYLSYQRSLYGGAYSPADPDSNVFLRADVDQDGRISIYDALRIRRYLAKMCKLDGSPYYD